MHCARAHDVTRLYGNELVNAHLLLLAVFKSFAAKMRNLTDEILNATRSVVRCHRDGDTVILDINTRMAAWKTRLCGVCTAEGMIIVGDDTLMSFQYSRGVMSPSIKASYTIRGVKPDDIRVKYDMRVGADIDAVLAYNIIEYAKPNILLTLDLNKIISRYVGRNASIQWYLDERRNVDSLHFRLYIVARPCTEKPELAVEIKKIEMPALTIDIDDGRYVTVRLHSIDGRVYAIHHHPGVEN